MNINKLKNSFVKAFAPAAMNLALLASPLSQAVATSAYYSRRSGGYSSEGTYLVDESLKGISKSIFNRQRITPKGKQQSNLPQTNEAVQDIILKKSILVKELVVVDQNIQDHHLFAKLSRPDVEIIEIPQDVNGFEYLLQKRLRHQSHCFHHLSYLKEQWCCHRSCHCY
ncbi:MAG: hypothetical protein AAF705_22705, partial [Bacteroidota bacterium]